MGSGCHFFLHECTGLDMRPERGRIAVSSKKAFFHFGSGLSLRIPCYQRFWMNKLSVRTCDKSLSASTVQILSSRGRPFTAASTEHRRAAARWSDKLKNTTSPIIAESGPRGDAMARPSGWQLERSGSLVRRRAWSEPDGRDRYRWHVKSLNIALVYWADWA